MIASNLAEAVSEEVDGAALPGGAAEDPGDRGLEAGVGVGNDQLNADQAACDEAAQEVCPVSRPGVGGDSVSWFP